MKISVYAIPASIDDRDLKERIAVVIDVLRAASTIITALNNGCKEINPTAEIEEAIMLAKNYEKDSFLLGGERNAVKIDGFDLSNSPYEYTPEAVKGRTVIMTTTNGTQAIRKANDAKEVIIGSFLNAEAVSRYIRHRGDDVVFVCAGTDGKFSLDDILVAGAMIDILEGMNTEMEMDDLALVSLHLYKSYKSNLKKALENAYHYKNLVRAGYEKDIDYCIQLNLFPIIPVYKDGTIRISQNFQG